MSAKKLPESSGEMVPPVLKRSESVEAFSDWLSSPLCDRDTYFRHVGDSMVFSREVMSDSVTQVLMGRWEKMISETPLTESFEDICLRMIRVAAGDELKDSDDATAKRWTCNVEGLGSGTPFRAMDRTKGALRAWQHPLLAAALQQCADTDLTNCKITCAMICRTASNCDAAKRFMFTLLVKRAVASLQVEEPADEHDAEDATAGATPSESAEPPAEAAAALADPSPASPAEPTGTGEAASGAGADAAAAALPKSLSDDGTAGKAKGKGMAPATARRILRSFCLERIDELKDKAVASAFYEPALWYLEKTGGSTLNFEVHAANSYLTFLAVVLGVRTSRQPYIDDPNTNLGLVHWRHCAPATAIEAFQDPKYLGKSWRAVAAVRDTGVTRTDDPKRKKLEAEAKTASEGAGEKGGDAGVQQAKDKLEAFERNAARVRWALRDGEVEAFLAGAEPYEAVHAAEQAAAAALARASGSAEGADASTGGEDAPAASGGGGDKAEGGKEGDKKPATEAPSAEPGAMDKPPTGQFLQKGKTPRAILASFVDGSASPWQMRAARGYAAHFASYFQPLPALQRLVVALHADGAPKSALDSVFEQMRSEQNADFEAASKAGAEGKGEIQAASGAGASAPAVSDMVPEGRPCLWPPLEPTLSSSFFFYDDEDYDFLTHNAVRFFYFLGMVRPAHVPQAARDAWAAYDAQMAEEATAESE